MFNLFKRSKDDQKSEHSQNDLLRWATQGLISKKIEIKHIPTDVMEIVDNDYPKEVQAIHNEFNTAGEKLVRNAREIICNTSVENKEKVERLHSLGFASSKQVVETKTALALIYQQEKIASAVQNLSVFYPNYKFVTTEIAEKICKKYGLLLAPVTNFKGFVPEKNLVDIERFFETYPEDKIIYYRRYNATHAPNAQKISKSEFENFVKENEGKNWKEVVYHVYSNLCTLFICAPLKDMDTTNMEIKGHLLVKHIPDPVVMIKKEYEGISGYLILTAWGDEASDEMVINHNQN